LAETDAPQTLQYLKRLTYWHWLARPGSWRRTAGARCGFQSRSVIALEL